MATTDSTKPNQSVQTPAADDLRVVSDSDLKFATAALEAVPVLRKQAADATAAKVAAEKRASDAEAALQGVAKRTAIALVNHGAFPQEKLASIEAQLLKNPAENFPQAFALLVPSSATKTASLGSGVGNPAPQIKRSSADEAFIAAVASVRNT
jgi:hypothetical protein